MKFWTVQSKDVAKIVKEKGIYQPDFSKSRYLLADKKLSNLYDTVRDNFNMLNKMKLPGIAYAFARRNGEKIVSIENYSEFKIFIMANKNVIDGLWKTLSIGNSEVLELDYEDTFNPIFIDINDFQFIMPPILNL